MKVLISVICNECLDMFFFIYDMLIIFLIGEKKRIRLLMSIWYIVS